MKRLARSWLRPFPLAASIIFALASLSAPISVANAAQIIELEVTDGIGVATAEYVLSGVRHAEDVGAELIIINMDTPGGLVKPMRDIVTAILGSKVPVATFVTPAGSRADSAGTYIVLASHIAAMTPTTVIGAATPVSIGGGDATPAPPPSPADEIQEDGEESGEQTAPQNGTALERKILNDSVSYIRGLAERHGRNADWAETAVTEAATLTAKEALEQNVIDFIAEDRTRLLEILDGHEVTVAGETITLETTGATVEQYEPNWRIKLLGAISNPEIVLLLGLIGIYGLMYEGWNPGAILPGVVGAICLLLAAYALQVLPVNYAGLALIFLGIALMVGEAYAPSFGALGIGGIAAFVFGAIMMFDTGVPGFGISLAFVIGLAVLFAALIIWLMSFILKLRRRGAVTGIESIVGAIGVAMEDFTGDGKVWLEGEAWHAHSAVPIVKDQEVVVRAAEGVVIDVEPVTDQSASGAQLQI